MGVSGQIHASKFCVLGNILRCPLHITGWTPEEVWALWTKQVSLAPDRNGISIAWLLHWFNYPAENPKQYTTRLEFRCSFKRLLRGMEFTATWGPSGENFVFLLYGVSLLRRAIWVHAGLYYLTESVMSFYKTFLLPAFSEDCTSSIHREKTV
jgi:hypothetical protein